MAVSPEGTRSKTQRWKTGFYWIAQQAGVPIVMTYLDYPRKLSGIGPVFQPTGDVEADMAAIKAWHGSIVGEPPPECMWSMEADIYPLLAPELADLIDGSIGQLSFFHDHFGYYAQGVGPETAYLPNGWKDRLIRLQTPATNGRIGYCVDPVNLFVSKACAAREKDLDFNRALLSHGVVGLDEVLARAEQLEVPAEARRAAACIHRLGAWRPPPPT